MLPSTQFANPAPPPKLRDSFPGMPSFRRPEMTSSTAMIGSSPALLAALEQARQAARSDADILLEAESGTGKELLARFIHEESARAAKPFVAINCAAVPENLLESELFGHVRGAFTGRSGQSHRQVRAGPRRNPAAGRDRRNAAGAAAQTAAGAAGARVLSPGRQPRHLSVNVRVIASTNRSLQGLVREGRFREDLYYRLNVIPLSLPPLRERGDDVIELAEYFAAKFAAPKPPPAMSEAFPRELCVAITGRAMFASWPTPSGARWRLCEGDEIDADALRLAAPPALGPAPWLKPGLSLREAEKALLEITLEATAGNRTHAAELLGVSLRTVRNKIREHGLPPRRRLS